jgi:hypothetical protein
MPNPDQCDIRRISPGVWRVECDFNESFIDYMKSRVPREARSYDPDTKIWTIKGDEYIAKLESIAVQKFSYVTRIFRDDQDRLIWKNLKTGREEVQASFFEQGKKP